MVRRILEHSPDDPNGLPLAELKMQLIFYLPSAPGPKTARRMLDLYFERFGDPFTLYYSTAFGRLPSRWDVGVKARFFTSELTALRKHEDWGYAFGDGALHDSWGLMFHGYRPVTEAPRSSFMRFEFAYDVDLKEVRAFAVGLMQFVPCLWGTLGFVFQGRPRGPLARQSFDKIYVLAKRYWGVEVLDLDETVQVARQGFSAVNWGIIIGSDLASRAPEALTAAKAAAYAYEDTAHGTLFLANEAPRLGDRNRGETLPGYVALAKALESLQLTTHPPFGVASGSKWEEGDRTLAWLRRFTDPNAFHFS